MKIFYDLHSDANWHKIKYCLEPHGDAARHRAVTVVIPAQLYSDAVRHHFLFLQSNQIFGNKVFTPIILVAMVAD